MKPVSFKMIKILVWIPVLVTGILITGFSAQNGNESSGLSRKAAIVIMEGAEAVHLVSFPDESEREAFVEKMQYPIRKGAHMTEYAVFTVFTYLAFWVDGVKLSKRSYLTLILAVVLACSDELHQRFVPGRCGSIKDVLIDTAGCVIALFVLQIIAQSRCTNQKTVL